MSALIATARNGFSIGLKGPGVVATRDETGRATGQKPDECIERSKTAIKLVRAKGLEKRGLFEDEPNSSGFVRFLVRPSWSGERGAGTASANGTPIFRVFDFSLRYDDCGTSTPHPRPSMPILAVCPFCQQGKVRAPDTAVGMSATCPSCHNCFTIVASSEPAAKTPPSKTAVAAKATLAAPPKPAVSDPTPLPAGITEDEALGIEAPAPLPAEEKAEPAREKIAVATFRPAPEPESESIFSLAMVAFILAGAALFASQITRFGRYATVALAMLGVFLSFLALISAYRGRRWPAIALAVNIVAIVLVTILPGWLALDSWWPAKVADDKGVTKVRPLNGAVAGMLEGGWLDISQGAWQRDDVLVTFSRAFIGKVDLTGPKEKHQFSKEKVLAIELKFTNVGAARRIDYRSWQQPAPPDAAPAIATDSTGKGLAAKKFDEGWEAQGHATNGSLMPGKSHSDWLVFEAPDPKADYVRLELPSWAFGDKGEPIRLHIPKSMIARQ